MSQSQNNQSKRNVMFVGGQTAGPIMPLLALAEAWVKQDSGIRPVFVDSRHSVASRLVTKAGFKTHWLLTGKLRRYWTWKNILTPFLAIAGLLQAFILLLRLRPKIVIGAGGFVQPPVVIAAWCLRIPSLIHQQDYVPSLSNKICAPFATKITTTFEKSLKDFSQGLGFAKNYSQYQKLEWTGNPCNIAQISRKEAQKMFNLDPKWPTVFLFGGSSGAAGLNEVLMHSLPGLIKIAQVIHATGRGKPVKPPIDVPQIHDRYHQFEFIDSMEAAYTASDIVVGRAGIGTITELSALGKIAILIPMPGSHQEFNAQLVFEQNAGVVLDQAELTPEVLPKIVRKILFDVKLQQQLQQNIAQIMPKKSTEKMLQIIKNIINVSAKDAKN
jgi:UDP-N-acetylglucosamine--N-acetylmuramyl-(pentapeptide) pyrophosphoryl-undecaprenol N-acetylglucosamine transferase